VPECRAVTPVCPRLLLPETRAFDSDSSLARDAVHMVDAEAYRNFLKVLLMLYPQRFNFTVTYQGHYL